MPSSFLMLCGISRIMKYNWKISLDVVFLLKSETFRNFKCREFCIFDFASTKKKQNKKLNLPFFRSFYFCVFHLLFQFKSVNLLRKRKERANYTRVFFVFFLMFYAEVIFLKRPNIILNSCLYFYERNSPKITTLISDEILIFQVSLFHFIPIKKNWTQKQFLLIRDWQFNSHNISSFVYITFSNSAFLYHIYI